jgi:hypothetical protein
MTTPVALITGWSDGRNASRSRAAAAASIRVAAAGSVAHAPSPPAIAARRSAAVGGSDSNV